MKKGIRLGGFGFEKFGERLGLGRKRQTQPPPPQAQAPTTHPGVELSTAPWPHQDLLEQVDDGRHGLFLGSCDTALVFGRTQLGLLALGPRLGATTGVVVPLILAAPGPVVATGTLLAPLWPGEKDVERRIRDVFRATSLARACRGRVWVFDPGGRQMIPPGAVRVLWEPTIGAGDWDVAEETGQAMAEVASQGRGGKNAGTLLAILLHLAGRRDRTTREVLRWITTRDISAIEASQEETLTADTCRFPGCLGEEDWKIAEAALAVYHSKESRDEQSFLWPPDFVSSTDTLYIQAREDEQRLVAPVAVSLINAIRRAAKEKSRDRSLARPVVLALDEVARSAPIPDLPQLIARGGSDGVLTAAVFQNLEEVRHLGPDARWFLDSPAERLVLQGIEDAEALDLVQLVVPDYEREITEQPETGWYLNEAGIWDLYMTSYLRTPPWPAVLISAMDHQSLSKSSWRLPIPEIHPSVTDAQGSDDTWGLAKRYWEAVDHLAMVWDHRELTWKVAQVTRRFDEHNCLIPPPMHGTEEWKQAVAKIEAMEAAALAPEATDASDGADASGDAAASANAAPIDAEPPNQDPEPSPAEDDLRRRQERARSHRLHAKTHRRPSRI